MSENEIIESLLIQVGFNSRKKFRADISNYNRPEYNIENHECSYIESKLGYFCIYYSKTGDFFFFEGSTPEGGFGEMSYFRIESNWLPVAMVSALKKFWQH